jgi:ribosomal protein S18 acetylase RimI-like enzyme
MRVERGEVTELDRLVALWTDLACEMREYGARVRPEDSEGTIREQLGHALVAGRVHVAREDGQLVGFLSHRTEDTALATDGIRAILTYGYVVPDRRGEGIGTELFETVRRQLEDAGHDAVALEVMADNEAARRFYRRLGYEPHRIELERPAEKSDTLSRDDE